MSKDKIISQASSVKYKKIDGTFFLLANCIKWKPKENHFKDFVTAYSNIKVQRISPESSSRVQLQLVLHDDSSHNFHFSHEKGRQIQIRERNEIKDRLAELIPQHRNKSNKDLEEKNKLLKEQPELYQLYKDLVVTGIITAEEFWDNQKQKKSEQPTNKNEQETGIASGFLADLKPDMHGCNELRFNLTADSINSIFRMYPAVKEKYIEVVPTKMTEKEFWTEFFKSQHFHRDRIPKIAGASSSKDMFGDLAKKDEQEQLKRLIDSFFDPLIDFSSTSPNTEEGYGMKNKDRGIAGNDPLIKQFNHQSLMVLYNSQKRNIEVDDSDDVKIQSKKKRVREAVEISELEEIKEVETSYLKIIDDTDKFASQSQRLENGHVNGNSSNNEEIENFKKRLSSWKPRLYQVVEAEEVRSVASKISPGGELMKTNNIDVSDSDTLNDITKEMRKNYLSLSELLRHFWCCFPIKTPALEEKVRRMATSLEKYKETNMANFSCLLPSQHQQLAHHLTDMIEVALKKYHAWESRKVATKLHKQ